MQLVISKYKQIKCLTQFQMPKPFSKEDLSIHTVEADVHVDQLKKHEFKD